MEYKRTNIGHCMTFMYCAFAHLTDGEVNKSEWKSIGAKVWGWIDTFNMDVTGDGKLDGDDITALVFECVAPHYDSLDFNARCEEFAHCIALLMDQDWWTDELSNCMLKDFKDLAMADGKFEEGEEGWLEIMAKQFGVSMPA